MGFSRHSRFIRSADIAGIQLTERDQSIIRLVYQHRFLRSPQIISLIRGHPQRLQLLFHHGYLERPRQQIEYFHNSGSRHLIYGLGNKGAKLLEQEFATSLGSVHWSAKNRSIGRIFLDHSLLVSDVMVALELACGQSGLARLVTERELSGLQDSTEANSPKFRWKVTVGNGVVLGVIPDRVFALEFSRSINQLSRAVFFLEADRSTMPVTRRSLSQTSFFRKLLAYEATWSQSVLQRFGITRFRVLTVTTSQDRVDSMVKACSKLKRGHGLFLFVERNALLESADILSATWQTARRGVFATLLD